MTQTRDTVDYEDFYSSPDLPDWVRVFGSEQCYWLGQLKIKLKGKDSWDSGKI